MKRFLFILLAMLTTATVRAQPLELRLAPERSTYKLGTNVQLQLQVKNLSETDITFTYVQPAFSYPTVHSGNGEANQVQAEVYNGPAQMVKVTVQPGEIQSLPTARFRVVTGPQSGPEASWQAVPGTYQLKYRLTLDGPAGAKCDLESNSVEVRVEL